MKTTKTFENATLRTVNSGYIELDYNGKTHCFNNASVVSVNNGNISIEVNWEPERGELIRTSRNGICRYVIFKSNELHSLIVFGSKDISSSWYKFSPHVWTNLDDIELQPVTPEEQQAFDDFCKSQGKIWNKEKLQWEEYKWSPKPGEKYWYVSSWGEVLYRLYIDTPIDQDLLRIGNAFPTKEKAKRIAEKLTHFFKSL